MKHLINAPENLITESVEGFLEGALGENLTRLDGFPHIKVILRSDWDKSKVALISGGGSGHEPAHAGFVGQGMLTAAVCGEVFASPSVDAVLAAILAVTGKPGCLLIVKNYTGDRLNFGLAAEKARNLGYKVEMVVVSDDIALPNAPQPRGLAGTILIHKIAGHYAEKRTPLEEVAQQAASAAERVYSLGLAVSNCNVPGQPEEERMNAESAELGLGIHGEPGQKTISMNSIDHLADLVLQQLETHLGPNKENPFAVMVNNLGALTPLEMNLITKRVFQHALAKQIDYVIGPANIMTALDMRGFSLTLLKLDADIETALLSDVAPLSWLKVRNKNTASPIVPLPKLPSGSTASPSHNPTIEKYLNTICTALIDNTGILNQLDSKIGDGDTGTTFATAAKAILAEMPQLPQNQPAELLIQLGDILAKAMGGSSGVLGSIFLTRAGNAIQQGKAISQSWLAGCEAIQMYGGAKVGDRTLLDALIPALDKINSGKTLTEAARSADLAANTTAKMNSARAGRASYVAADHLEGVIDPGAKAIAIIFAALARAASLS